MAEEVEHNCFVCVAHTLHDAENMAQTMPHRGPDSTGLFAQGMNGIDVLKWKGPITRFGNKALQRIFPAGNYHTFGFHGRYKTRGKAGIDLAEGHPHVIGGVVEDKGDHILIRGCKKAIIHNGQIEDRFLRRLDRSRLKTKCDSEALLHFYDQFGIETLLREIPDGYTLAIADVDNNGTIIARGRHGLKPGFHGTKDGFDCFASESVALRELRARFRGDLVPGALYYLRPDGKMSEPQQIVKPDPKHCVFEFKYFAHPHSIIERVPVIGARWEFGEKLAEEFHPEDVEAVTFFPETPIDSALTYSEKIKKPLVEAFYKITGERSFLQPTQHKRRSSIRENLRLIPNAIPLLRGRVVLVIDDSIIRGTVAQEGVGILFDQAKIKKCYVASYTPRVGVIGKDGIPRGCDFGGVDMPSKESVNNKFIARGRTLDEISEIIGAPVYYLSIKGSDDACRARGLSPESLCRYCQGGEHPFKDFQNR